MKKHNGTQLFGIKRLVTDLKMGINKELSMEFSEEDGKNQLCYFIDFEPRLPFMLFGSLLKSAIEKPVRKNLEKLSKEMPPVLASRCT